MPTEKEALDLLGEFLMRSHRDRAIVDGFDFTANPLSPFHFAQDAAPFSVSTRPTRPPVSNL
jgi:hypothetical protein